MNVNGIYDLFSTATSGADRSLVLRADQEFNLALKLGQVLKGKVLRHYEGGRYSVSFGGQEKVVDSAVPLRIGDTIQGRVVAIDDKVHLQRIVDSTRDDAARQPAPGGPRDDITALFARYQVQLTPVQHQALSRLVSRLGGSKLVAPSALILHKLGLPQDPALVQAIHQVLVQARADSGLLNTQSGPKLPSATTAGSVNNAVVHELAPLLAQLSDEVADVSTPQASDDAAQTDAGADHRQGEQRDLWQLGQWLLNMQGEGSLAHRFIRFPVWLDDSLVEVSMALYSQHDRHPATNEPGALRHHKVVFSLATGNLGHVEIEALVADRHLRLTVSVERQYAAERLAEYLTTLTAALNAHDWHVDEIRYRTRDDLTGVMQSIVEHHITPDSLSQLM